MGHRHKCPMVPWTGGEIISSTLSHQYSLRLQEQVRRKTNLSYSTLYSICQTPLSRSKKLPKPIWILDHPFSIEITKLCHRLDFWTFIWRNFVVKAPNTHVSPFSISMQQLNVDGLLTCPIWTSSHKVMALQRLGFTRRDVTPSLWPFSSP